MVTEWAERTNYKYLHGKMDEYERIEKNANHERTNPLIALHLANVSYAAQATSSANIKRSRCICISLFALLLIFLQRLFWILNGFRYKLHSENVDELCLEVTSGLFSRSKWKILEILAIFVHVLRCINKSRINKDIQMWLLIFRKKCCYNGWHAN